MGERIGPLVLIFAGALPGIVGWIAAYVLWRRHRILEEDEARQWVRIGYFYLAVFVVAALVATNYFDADPFLMAFGWIGAPAFTGMLGIWVFAERQRLSREEFPPPATMRSRAIENRQELRYVATELATDLDRLISAQESVQRGGAMVRGRRLEVVDLERLQSRIRSAIQRTHELEARFGPHLRRLRAVIEEPLPDEEGAYEAREAQIAELQSAQRELERMFDRLLDTAVELREDTNRLLANVTWIAPR